MSTRREIKLKGWGGRTLSVHVSSGGIVNAIVSIVIRNRYQMLAYSGGINTINDCLLRTTPQGDIAFWIGHSAFDVSREEAQQLERELVPLGLKVELKKEPA